MSGMEERMAAVETDVAVLKNEHEHVDEALETIKDRITGMNEKKIDPMVEQVKEIHAAIEKRTGFRAGVVFTVSTGWAILVFLAANVFDFFKS